MDSNADAVAEEPLTDVEEGVLDLLLELSPVLAAEVYADD